MWLSVWGWSVTGLPPRPQFSHHKKASVCAWPQRRPVKETLSGARWVPDTARDGWVQDGVQTPQGGPKKMSNSGWNDRGTHPGQGTVPCILSQLASQGEGPQSPRQGPTWAHMAHERQKLKVSFPVETVPWPQAVT